MEFIIPPLVDQSFEPQPVAPASEDLPVATDSEDLREEDIDVSDDLFVALVDLLGHGVAESVTGQY